VLPKVSNLSNFTERYDKFQVLTQFTQGGQYKYVAYESNTTALSGAIGVVETGLAQVETDQAAFASDGGVTRYVAFDTVEASVNPAPAPTIETAAGIYAGFANIVISSLVSGTIYYTTDGTTPSSQNGTLYTSAFNITSTTLIQARQYVDGFTLGEVANAFYTINPITLTATPDTGTYLIGTLDPIVLETDSEGATIYYTTDGSTPTEASTEYTGAITPFDVITTLKARAYNSPASPSEVLTEVYSIQALAPTVSPASGTFINEQLVCFSNPNPQGQVFVSLNGGAFQDITDECVILEEITTYVAEVRSEAYVTSAQVSGTISIQCSAPTISPAGQAFEDDIEVTITTTAPSGTTYYTLDGSEPTQSSLLYTAPFTLTATAQVRAKTFRIGTLASETSVANYTLIVQTWYNTSISISRSQRYSIDRGSTWQNIFLNTLLGTSNIDVESIVGADNGVSLLIPVVSANDISKTGVYRSNDRGLSVTKSINGRERASLIAASLDLKYSICTFFDGNASAPSCAVSADGGVTYTNVAIGGFNVPKTFLTPLVSGNGQRMFIAGDLRNGANANFVNGAWMSNDFGVTWNQVIPSASEIIDSAIMSKDGLRIMAIVKNTTGVFQRVTQSTDGGNTFATLAGVPTCDKIVASDDFSVIYVWNRATNSMSKSVDFGANWTSLTPPSVVSPREFYTNPLGTNLMVAFNNALWRSLDGGLTFSQMLTGAERYQAGSMR
jgi:hypothetical protein